MALIKKAVLLVVACFISLAHFKPSEFDQCDSDWRDIHLANKSDWPTICEAGDQLTVLAMIADGCSIRFPGKTKINPKSLNDWLAANNGFKEDQSIDLATLGILELKNTLETDQLYKIKMQFKYNWYEVAVKDKRGHWFALKSYSSSTLMVVDPKGDKDELDNDDFKMGDVFFNQKCKRGSGDRGEYFLTE